MEQETRLNARRRSWNSSACNRATVNTPRGTRFLKIIGPTGLQKNIGFSDSELTRNDDSAWSERSTGCSYALENAPSEYSADSRRTRAPAHGYCRVCRCQP